MSEEKNTPSKSVEDTKVEATPSPMVMMEKMLADMQAQVDAVAEENQLLKTQVEQANSQVMPIPNGGHIELDEAAMAKLKNEVADKETKMMNITIAGAVGEANRPVFVGVQGVGWKINRGVMARVPMPVVHALQNAIKSHFNCDLEGNITESLVPLYPFTLHV